MEAAQRGDRAYRPQRIDTINLPRLAAGPQIAFTVKRQAFRVIQNGGEDFELWLLRHETHSASPRSSHQAAIVSPTSVSITDGACPAGTASAAKRSIRYR